MKKYIKSLIEKNIKSKQGKRHIRLPYSLSSKPQRYGPGKNRAIINIAKEVSANATGRFSVQSLFQENSEFNSKRGLFRYFKIEEIRATFLPSNLSGSFSSIVVLMSWWLTSHTPSEMYQDDASKMIPSYRTRPITLRFLPPRTVLDVQTTSQTYPNKFFDFSMYLSTDMTVNFPGWLYVLNSTSASLYFNFQAVVLFRGNDNQGPPARVLHEDDPYSDKITPLKDMKNLSLEDMKDSIPSESFAEDEEEDKDPPDKNVKELTKDMKTFSKDDQTAFEIQQLEQKLKKMKENFKPSFEIFKIPDNTNKKDSVEKTDKALVDLFKDDNEISKRKKPKNE